MKILLFFLLFFGLSGSLFAQFGERYLVLDKPSIWHKHRTRFNIGEEITLKMKNTRLKDRILISNLTDTSILMGGIEIPLRDVSGVSIRREGTLRSSGAVVLPLAGVMFLLIDTINSSHPDGRVVSDWGIRTGGSMIGVGLLLKFTQKRTYHLTWFRTLHVLRTF